MQQLRLPETGCPWDRQQSFRTIVPYTIEEAYEVADAIENGTMDDVKDELGDLLFQIIFYAQLGQESNDFDFDEIVECISDKLIRRHPHVFSEQKNMSQAQLSDSWDAIKQSERLNKKQPESDSILENIPTGMAPLVRATKIQKQCAKVGFDWPNLPPVIDKIEEEIAEVLTEVDAEQQDQNAIEEEVGDLLFAVVNLSRHLNVDAEAALRKANHKFEQRFRKVEQHFVDQKKPLKEASLDEMEAVWQKIKSN